MKPYFFGTLDDNLVNLVFELNSLPGIVTIASCGGHDNPKPTQKPKGKWFVSFKLVAQISPFGFHRSDIEYRGLMLLIEAMDWWISGLKLEITWDKGRYGTLSGCADPDALAENIDYVRQEHNVPDFNPVQLEMYI